MVDSVSSQAVQCGSLAAVVAAEMLFRRYLTNCISNYHICLPPTPHTMWCTVVCEESSHVTGVVGLPARTESVYCTVVYILQGHRLVLIIICD